MTLLAAASLAIVTGAAALAVDLGQLFGESRRLQGMADAAAMAAAADPGQANAAAQAVIAAGRTGPPPTPAIVLGTWAPDASLSPTARFAAGGGSPNAARVTLAEEAPLFFGRALGIGSIHLARTATAARIDLAGFTLGSRLAAVNGGLANQLLGALAGSNVSLSVADYQALADADVDLFAYAAALRSELHLTGGSFTQVLATRTTLPPALNALAQALGAGAAAAAAARLANSVGPVAIAAGQLVDLGPAGAQDRLDGGRPVLVNAYALVQAMLQLAGGTRQVTMDLGTTVGGLARASVTLAVGDRQASSPWVTVTAKGEPVVRISQLRLFVDAGVDAPAALRLAGVTGVRLPVFLELAQAQAKLSSIGCAAGNRSVALAVQPSLGHAAVADVAPATLLPMSNVPAEPPATFVNLAGVLRVSGSATMPFSSGDWQQVSFSGAEIDARATRTVSAGGSAGAIAAGLDSRLDVTVGVNTTALASPVVAALVKPLLDAAAGPVDQLLADLLGVLGVHPGQADVRIDGVRCGTAALVA